ncbi:MAG: alanine--glyoxylate aminotransferase family protein [Thermoanaerobaculia bacterium]
MSEAIRYFVPGPCYVLESTRRAMLGPVVGHRSPEFRPVYARITERLRSVFRTERDAYLATSSSTLLMEAALVSLTGGAVLHLVNGAFSERWRDIARSLGREADEIAVPWGEGVDPELLRAALRRKRYDAVTMAHNETSTGVLQPVDSLARVVREESEALVLVDAVSSLAGARLETDAWDLDFVFAGSQKGLAAPPGLALFTFSERAERRAGSIPHRGYYGDLLRYRDKHREGGPITTAAVSIAYALDAQLERIEREGLEARWARHLALYGQTASWVEANGCSWASSGGVRSPTVSCLRPPAGIDAPLFVRGMKERGFTLGGGYGRFKDSTFRIGHMGEVQSNDLAALFAAMEEEIAA